MTHTALQPLQEDEIARIPQCMEKGQELYLSGKTKDIGFRKAQLEKLYDTVSQNKEALANTLHQDLNKSAMEAYMTEIGLLLEETRYLIKKFPSWAKAKKARAGHAQMPAKIRIIQEPYGQVLIISPWNYPLVLSLEPIAAAIAAGNTVILKPSPYSPETSRLMANLLEESLEDGLVSVLRGGREVNQALLDQKFDYIFFTGSARMGKIVMAKASEQLTPVTLELGGKSPCIIEKSANLKLAAKRIAFGKLVNAGQTCVAPDYVLVDRSVTEEFTERLSKELSRVSENMYYFNESYPKIINDKHYSRLQALLEGQENIRICGDDIQNPNTRQISPRLVMNPNPQSDLMQEEIFGPILPILEYENLDEAMTFVRNRPRPLALYCFSEDKEKTREVMTGLSFGGGAVNDCLLHIAGSHAPFGGVGNSGMGNYHGKFGFDTFTHQKTVLKKGRFMDLSLRYPPFQKKDLKLLEKVLK